MERRRILESEGTNVSEEWTILEERVTDGSYGEVSFAMPKVASEVMILVEYSGSETLLSGWEVFSVNGSSRYGIINSAPKTSGGRQLLGLKKIPFGYLAWATNPYKGEFAGAASNLYYNLISLQDGGIEKFTFGSDKGKSVSGNGVSWKIYYK